MQMTFETLTDIAIKENETVLRKISVAEIQRLLEEIEKAKTI
jgi:hypothetical protein